MSKEDWLSIFVYALMLVIAIVVGVYAIQPAVNSGALDFKSQGLMIGYDILWIVVGIIVNAIFVEICHLIGAKIGGYEILAFNVLYFEFYKTEKKDDPTKKVWKFHFKGFNGLAGETKIAPKNEKSNPMPYVFGPLVFFLIEAIAIYCAFIFMPDFKENSTTYADSLTWLKYGIIIICTLGFMFCLYNYFPAKLDNDTDGYRLTLLNKKINIAAYNEYLNVLGRNLLLDENYTVKQFEIVSDFTANVNMLGIYKNLETSDFENAINILDQIIEAPKVSKATKLDAKVQKAFIYLLTKSEDEAKAFYNETFKTDEKKFIMNNTSYITLKVYLMYAGLIEKSQSEVDFCLKKVKKAGEGENKGIVFVEERLFKKALEKVKESGIRVELSK